MARPSKYNWEELYLEYSQGSYKSVAEFAREKDIYPDRVRKEFRKLQKQEEKSKTKNESKRVKKTSQNKSKPEQKKKKGFFQPGNQYSKGHGAPKGNKNAVGHGAPKGNPNAVKHGLFSRYIPEDELEDALSFMDEVDEMSMLDITWLRIKFLLLKLAKAEGIAWVKDKNDRTTVLKRERSKLTAQTSESEKEWEIQHAWDKNNSYLNSLAKVEGQLNAKIRLYADLIKEHGDRGFEVEEHRLRIDKLKADIAKVKEDSKDKPMKVVIVDDIPGDDDE